MDLCTLRGLELFRMFGILSNRNAMIASQVLRPQKLLKKIVKTKRMENKNLSALFLVENTGRVGLTRLCLNYQNSGGSPLFALINSVGVIGYFVVGFLARMIELFQLVLKKIIEIFVCFLGFSYEIKLC